MSFDNGHPVGCSFEDDDWPEDEPEEPEEDEDE
jgi:hypothetical protein